LHAGITWGIPDDPRQDQRQHKQAANPGEDQDT
jgi:hypothetical protein